jgi:DNA-binding PadR family transcriptional regulator
MKATYTRVLGYTLMGLLHQKALPGYELRKVFATTRLSSFSDSPGSIYPALARLENGSGVAGMAVPSGRMSRRPARCAVFSHSD